jgi:multiple sugar transport system substrate-binding protein
MFLKPPHTAARLSARRFRRVAAVAVSVGALLFTAACSGGDTPNPAASTGAGDFSHQGPIEYWTAKDVTGNQDKLIAEFNAQHPQGQVSLHILPEAADQQRLQMIQNTQIKNDKMTVLSVDNVWTAEFAANQYIIPLPEDRFPTSSFLKPPVESATYFGKLYAYPYQTDGGLLYYRSDLLKKYNLQAPTTWGEMTAACKTIKAGENNPKLDCSPASTRSTRGSPATSRRPSTQPAGRLPTRTASRT